jgi:ElaB/YqjD/DUF883 family membrane-anchored ribosome-binding protein
MEKLVEDMRILMGDTQELLRATAGQAGEKIVEVRNKVQQSVDKAQAAVREQADLTAEQTATYVRENPWTVIGISAGIGFLIGLLVGRR